MKCRPQDDDTVDTRVTLHVRVWIEMFSDGPVINGFAVTLHVRVWIEIY